MNNYVKPSIEFIVAATSDNVEGDMGTKSSIF